MSNGTVKKSNATSQNSKPSHGKPLPPSPRSPIPRSASNIQLQADGKSYEHPTRTDSIRRSFSEDVLPVESPEAARVASFNFGLPLGIERRSDEVGRPTPGTNEQTVKRHSKASDFFVGPEHETQEEAVEDGLNGDEKPATKRAQPRRSVSGSITNFARRSWIAPARSPSPSPHRRRSFLGVRNTSTEVQRPPVPDLQRARVDRTREESGEPTSNGNTKRPGLLRRKSRESFSSLMKRKSIGDVPAVPSIPKSIPTEKVPSLRHKSSNLSDATTIPGTSTYERLQGLVPESPRKKDELWGAFRALENEYQKFQSRPSTTKTAIVRSALLPFLRNHADHPSNLTLRPEDVDRRTVILNKWWMGLLEMLNGRHGESVSGNDRPAVLDAVAAIMVRPEWTTTLSAMPPRSGKGFAPSLASKSQTSLGSNMSEFLVDSVLHNIKNTFTQNLLAQMAYVVQKMSTRNVPASVVAFCGKAITYAFFYCDGVAAILVHLWKITPQTLRRVTAEYGLARIDNLGSQSERLASEFPASLHPLIFRSIPAATRFLRSHAHLPIALTSIPWHGPWVNRWAGRDTDLFFVFAKHYTELVCRHISENATVKEQMAAPAWIFVQAQLLKVIQSTVDRPSGPPHAINQPAGLPTSSPEDPLGEADATATMLSVPSGGMIRSMAENRTIMLLRDCLGTSNLMADKAQSIFADAFDRLLKAVAKGISIFDHATCFTLCDFLEEAIAILTRFYKASNDGRADFDWDFWFDVCQKMLQSQNTMTQVRTFAFIYSMWGSILQSDARRRNVCLGWLLSRDTFQKQFNHWCPMVRSYYMRLLVWRVARPSDSSSTLDFAIIGDLRTRLIEDWQSYLSLSDEADSRGLLRPSTAPCSPAPGRQLLILRDDVQAASSGMFMSFEGILSSNNMKANQYGKVDSMKPDRRRESMLSNNSDDSDISSSSSGRKKWGGLKSLLQFTSHQPDRQQSPSRRSKATPDSLTEQPTTALRGPSQMTSDAVAHLPSSVKKFDGSSSSGEGGTGVPYRSLSFKFSLEWVDRSHPPPQSAQRLPTPSLPPLAAAQFNSRHQRLHLDGANPLDDSAKTLPLPPLLSPNKYAGRALAEWNLLIAECEHFFDRRMAEGVPSRFLVETPTLSVESFRRP